jgi:molybdopterin-biosynthesis enzyme MoeA-like protein
MDVLPDEVEVIGKTVAERAAEVDTVFTTGGVGTTHDDVTMAGIAHGLGRRLVHLPELEAQVRAYWGERFLPIHLRLAEAPEGAELVRGDPPRWTAVRIENVYVFPGVPSLLQCKFKALRERFRAPPFVCARIYCSGEESALEGVLSQTVNEYPSVRFGSYPRFDQSDHSVLLTLESKDPGMVSRAMGILVSRLGDRVLRTEGQIT